MSNRSHAATPWAAVYQARNVSDAVDLLHLDRIDHGNAALDESDGFGSTSGTLVPAFGADGAGGVALSAADATWSGSTCATPGHSMLSRR